MSDYYELPEVLLEELKTVETERGTKRPDDYYTIPVDDKKNRESNESDDSKRKRNLARFAAVVPKLRDARLAALCLSGGGIRSATFNLGILQALAKKGFLKQIDYLSTVSGGGYIGSWFSSWIARQSKISEQPVDDVIKQLAQETPYSRCNEPCQVRFLRDYSNYLTPRVGVLSVDTWAIIGTYLRNLILNWLVLVPLIFAFLLLPRLATGLIAWKGAASSGLPLVGGLLGLLPIAYTVVDLPSIGDAKLPKGRFVLFFLAPLVSAACVLSAYWAQVYRPGCPMPELQQFLFFGLVVHLLGWLLGTLLIWKRHLPSWGWILLYFVCAAATGAVAGLLGWVAATKLAPALIEAAPYPNLLYATLSVPAVLTVYLLTGALMVALLSRFTGDEDREWWGRSAGVIILFCLVWSGLMAVVIYGPWLILPEATSWWQSAYTAVGAVSGVAVALLGKGAATPALRPAASMEKLRTTALAAAAALFLLFLTQILSLLTTVLLWLYHPSASPQVPRGFFSSCSPSPGPALPVTPLDFNIHLKTVCGTGVGQIFLMAGVSLLATFLMAAVVNINKFSMHAMYRNRLIRCYLGASVDPDERKANLFTGFDRCDDLDMDCLPKRPFHVVNIAWNLVKGRRLAWQQRKAASFIMTPLVAGSDIGAIEKDGVQPGGFRRIQDYGAEEPFGMRHPMTVGTAMAISGAAASPNMGYHSSPLVTFVMAFFNVRLGWWLGNPGSGMGKVWRNASPWLSARPLLKETFGLTSEENKDIYLSDGGHFENLGIYEMVRRRCRYIIVSDSGCDDKYQFEDLGNAVRKVRADFGIEIVIDLTALLQEKAHFAVGTVKYRDCDDGGEDGDLLYIKPVLTKDEPVDDFNYHETHNEFPHESTADQWFDEAQFESYRRLGLHSLEELIDGQKMDVEGLMKKARKMHDALITKLKQEPTLS